MCLLYPILMKLFYTGLPFVRFLRLQKAFVKYLKVGYKRKLVRVYSSEAFCFSLKYHCKKRTYPSTETCLDISRRPQDPILIHPPGWRSSLSSSRSSRPSLMTPRSLSGSPTRLMEATWRVSRSPLTATRSLSMLVER